MRDMRRLEISLKLPLSYWITSSIGKRFETNFWNLVLTEKYGWRAMEIMNKYSYKPNISLDHIPNYITIRKNG